jgi:fructan beta-fructosidase
MDYTLKILDTNMNRHLFFVLLVLFGFQAGAWAQTPTPVSTPTPQWRPVYHFTPEKNWTNDPNGPIYLNGKWIVYNQQNPFENKWGHMSWGHAVSTDLLHWQHLPVAIPEVIDRAKGDTTWIFSGSAVWDEHNTSGFCTGGGCLVAIYTAHQPNIHKESQYIAYSNDGGMSFTNYTGNPVIDLQKRDFRDPNVFWHKPSGQWVMAVSLPSEHKIRIYGSANLKDWNLLSEFGPEGYIGANWECPSLIELPVVGGSGGAQGAPSGGTKWVLMNSAAGGKRGVFMQYFVGNFDGKTFKNDNPADVVLTVDYGDCFYAAIPWNNAQQDAKILVGWMIPPKQETYPWRGQFSIPRDLSLVKTSAGYRLQQQPAAVIRKAIAGTLAATPTSLDKLAGNSYWLDAEWDVSAGSTVGFKLAGGTVVAYDAAAHQVYVDRGKGDRLTLAVMGADNHIRLQVLFDNSSLEVFVNGGEQVLTTYVYPPVGATGCSVIGKGGVKNMQVWDLSKI